MRPVVPCWHGFVKARKHHALFGCIHTIIDSVVHFFFLCDRHVWSYWYERMHAATSAAWRGEHALAAADEPTVLIQTRFSIADASTTTFRMARGEPDASAYLAKVWAPDRLHAHATAFCNLCLPSVLRQSDPRWRWAIYTNAAFPGRGQLAAWVACDARIAIVTAERTPSDVSAHGAAWLAAHPRGCTMRLDDDDGLPCTAIADVLAAEREGFEGLLGYFVAQGIVHTNVDASDTTLTMVCTPPKREKFLLASGLSWVHGNVHAAGDHTRVHVGSTPWRELPGTMAITCSPACDTERVAHGPLTPFALCML